MKIVPRSFQKGFSLIEMIVIIVIISVLAVFSIGRFADEESFSARGYYDELSAATRFAQRYAVSSGCTVQINITLTTYAVTLQDASCGVGTAVQGPTGANFSGSAPSGVTVTSGTGDHEFNARGDLDSGGGMVTVQGGGGSHSFTITAATGFVDS